MLRKICSVCAPTLLVLLLIGSSAWSAASEPNVKVVADGYVLGFDEGPLVVDGRVLVSWRNLALFYGFELDYDAEAQRIITQWADRTLLLTVGSTKAKMSEESVTLDVAPFLKEGRVLVPLRSAAEGLGLAVSWEEAGRTVLLSSGEQPAPPPIPTLTPAEIRSARMSFPTSLDSRYVSQIVTAETPEGAALIEKVAAAWQRAVPGVYATEAAAQGFMIPGLAPPGIDLELAEGLASVALVPVRKGDTAGWNTKGFLRLWLSRSGLEESVLVYAPELFALIDRSYWPQPPD